MQTSLFRWISTNPPNEPIDFTSQDYCVKDGAIVLAERAGSGTHNLAQAWFEIGHPTPLFHVYEQMGATREVATPICTIHKEERRLRLTFFHHVMVAWNDMVELFRALDEEGRAPGHYHIRCGHDASMVADYILAYEESPSGTILKGVIPTWLIEIDEEDVISLRQLVSLDEEDAIVLEKEVL